VTTLIPFRCGPVVDRAPHPWPTERTIYAARWGMVALLVLLDAILDTPARGLLLAASVALVLTNFVRYRRLIRVPARVRRLSIVLALADGVALCVGLWPLLRQGTHPFQLLLLLLPLEATHRLRATASRRAVIWLTAATIAPLLYELVGIRYHEEWRNVVLWCLSFALVGARGIRAVAAAARSPASEAAPASTCMSGGPGAVPDGTAAVLTPKQREVLRLVAAGLTTEELAERLSLSPQTVRVHLRAINRRLGTHSRQEAVARARACGLLT
jgi:DNA-binding CsgD family transcriptional regulator